MATLTKAIPDLGNWHMILTVARREIRDTLRDWRLVLPILGLTLLFPALMIFVAERMTVFLQAYNSELIGDRAVPLLLMVVGFFPTSFSLVIALEAFVGEQERKSLEPLLSTPLSDTQLYLGKMLAAVVPPVLASYIGIFLYTIGVFVVVGPMEWISVFQIIVLTTAQALMMVSASVVISSQTTSVRAANMLASFIIVPVALLLQGEAVLMIYQYYWELWLIIGAVLVTTVIFMRMGIHLFNREQLLGRNIDYLRLGWSMRLVWHRFRGRREDGTYPTITEWYRQLFALVPQLRQPMALLMLMFFASFALGYMLSRIFPIPAELLNQLNDVQTKEKLLLVQEYLNQVPLLIFGHNLRTMGLVAILGTLSFGVGSVLVFMLPWGLIGFVTFNFAAVGENPLVFLGATILPHAWVELPALLLVVAAALRWQAVIIAPPRNRTISEHWLEAGADFLRIFVGLGIPLFFTAAMLESFLTPAVMVWVYG